MLEALVQFCVMLLTAMTVENAVFTRALGMDTLLISSQTPKQTLWIGGLLTVIIFTSSVLVCAVRALLRNLFGGIAQWIRAPIFLAVICIVFILVYFVSQKLLPKIFEAICPLLTVATFNTVVLGGVLLSNTTGYSLAQSLGFALGISIGYTASMFLMQLILFRLSFCSLPAPFKGMPSLLIYIGLVALAFYGLIGHQLPF